MGAEEERKSRELPCLVTVMRDTLAAVDRVLDVHNLPHYVAAGTLPGIAGPLGNALRNDEDFAANYILKIWNRQSINFYVHKYNICIRERAPLAKKWTAAATGGDLIAGGKAALFGDLCMAREEEGHISNGGECWFPNEWVYPLKRMKFVNGMETWAVANAHKMLTANYGADYMPPPAKRKKWGAGVGGDKCVTYKKGHRLRPASELVM